MQPRPAKHVCFVLLGQIPYWNMSEEMFAIEKVLNSSQYISNDSIQFWYQKFYKDCCRMNNVKDYCIDMMNYFSGSDCTEG